MKMKRFISLLVALVMVLAMAAPAFADDEPTTYTVTVDNATRRGGSVKVNGNTFLNADDFADVTPGEEVKFQMVPNELLGYTYFEYWVENVNTHEEIPVTAAGKTTFTFVMPESDVIIHARFATEAPTPDAGELKLTCNPSFIAVGGGATLNAQYRAPGSEVWHFVTSESTISTTGNSVTIDGIMTIKGINAGTATITATYTPEGGEALTATCTVTVVAGIVVDPATCSLAPGETKDLVLKDADSGVVIPTGLDLTATSSAPAVATVSTAKEFKVTVAANATAGDQATITATWGGLSATCVVTVVAPDAGELKLTCNPSFIAVGGGATLNAQYRAPGSEVWHFVTSESTISATGNYVTISGMGVTGVTAGTATITATYTPEGGEALTATCTVTVVAAIVVDPAECSLLPGEAKDLVLKDADTGAVIPAGLDFTATSSDTGIATVSTLKEFKVTVANDAEAGDHATITATWNGLTATCVVTVVAEAEAYEIRYVYEASGGTVVGPATAEAGATVQVRFTPAEGNCIYDVGVIGCTSLVKPEFVLNGLLLTFTMPAENTEVAVKFTKGYRVILDGVNADLGEFGGAPSQSPIDHEGDVWFFLAYANQSVDMVIRPDTGNSVSIAIETVANGTPVAFTNNDGNVNFTMPAEDVIVHAVFSEPDPAEFSASLTLKDNLNINLYISNVSAEEIGNYTIKVKTYHKDADWRVIDNTNPNLTSSGYKYTLVELFSFQMTYPVEIQVLHNGQLVFDRSQGSQHGAFSAQEYLGLLYDYVSSWQDLVVATLNYGTQAQTYFNGKTYVQNGQTYSYDTYMSNLANSLSQMEGQREAYLNYAQPDLRVQFVSENIEGVSDIGISLVLGTETTIKIQFKYTGNVSDLTATCSGGKTASIVNEGNGKYSIRVPMIKCYELGKLYTFTLTDTAGNTTSIKASAYDYINLNWSATGGLDNLVKALYAYGIEADKLW